MNVIKHYCLFIITLFFLYKSFGITLVIYRNVYIYFFLGEEYNKSVKHLSRVNKNAHNLNQKLL